MKRLLSVLLIFSILISCMFVRADNEMMLTTYNVNQAQIIEILSALDIIKTFDGIDKNEVAYFENPIKRCELVSLAMELINEYDLPYDGNVIFSDVTQDSEYFKVISNAAKLGIISGYEDGTFHPGDVVSYDEAISVLLSTLGYRVAAEVKGGWSSGYLSVANKIGLTDGINVDNFYSLSRMEVLRLIFNAIDCPVLVEDSFGGSINYSSQNEHTVLSLYHDIYSSEGSVNATFVSPLAGYNTVDANEIIIDDEKYTVEKNAFIEYLGYYVKFYYMDNGMANGRIVYITPSEDVKELTIQADDISKYENNTYYYGKNKKAKIAINHSVIVNGKRLTDYNEDVFVPNNGNVTLLTYRGVCDTVIINTFHNFVVQRAQKGAETTATFTSKYNYRLFDVDMSDENIRFDLYIDGVKFDFKEFTYETTTDNFFDDKNYDDTPITVHTTYTFPVIPEGAVASLFADDIEMQNGYPVPSDNAKFIRIYITTDYIEGTVDGIENNGNYAVIDGQKYKIAYDNSLNMNSETFNAGVYGRFVKDCDGYISAWMPDIYAKDGYLYGYLINAKKCGSGLSSKIEAKMLKTDGSIDIYEFADVLILNSNVLKNSDEILSKLGESAAMLDPTFTISQLIKYKLNGNGKINDIQTVLQSVGLPDGADRQHLNRDMERIKLSHSENMFHVNGDTEKYPNAARIYSPNIYAIHFCVPPTETFDDDDYWIQDTWKVNFSRQDWLNNGWKYADVFDCNDFRAPNAVVVYEKVTDREFIQGYVLVDRITSAVSREGSYIKVLRGYDGWGTVAYYSYKDNMFDGLKQGDFVKLYGKNEKVTKVEMVMSIDDVKNCDIDKVPDDLYNGVFEVYAKDLSTKHLVLQRGTLLDNGKREFQRASFFRGGGGPASGGFTTGPIFFGESDRLAVFSFFESGSRDSFTDINTVLEVGNENATRVYVREQPGLKVIIVYDLQKGE